MTLKEFVELFKLYERVGLSNFACFIISKELMDRYVSFFEPNNINSDDRLKEVGYRNYYYKSIPILWDDDLTGNKIISIRKDLVNALADKNNFIKNES